jgi:hypothetical protein
LAFSYENPICMGLLYGRAGRLTAENGGFGPGQFSADSVECTHDKKCRVSFYMKGRAWQGFKPDDGSAGYTRAAPSFCAGISDSANE